MKNIVYKIENSINDKIYIGSSVKENIRTNQHIHHLKKGTHHNRPLQNFVNKYGIDKIKFVVLEKDLPIDMLIIREQYHIDLNKENKILFNIRMRAESMIGTKRTEEQKIKMVQNRLKKSGYPKGNTMSEQTKNKIKETRMLNGGYVVSEKQKSDHSLRMKGRKATDETKVKISKILTGRTLSEDHKKNLSKSAIGNTNWKNVDYKNPERNKKISKSMKERMSKKVVNTITGEIYLSAKIVADLIGMPQSTFCKNLAGYNKKNKTIYEYFKEKE